MNILCVISDYEFLILFFVLPMFSMKPDEPAKIKLFKLENFVSDFRPLSLWCGFATHVSTFAATLLWIYDFYSIFYSCDRASKK